MEFRKPEPTDKMTDHAEQHGFIYDEVGKLQNEPTVAIGDIPPTDEDSKEGDLWWDSDRMEMFIRYQDAWITTNALSARVEAGEQVQAELLARVAVGEEQQVILQNKVNALEKDEHEHEEYLTNSGNQELTQTWRIRSNDKTFMTISDDKTNIYHVADPDAATHVANRNYVDTVKESLEGAIETLQSTDILQNGQIQRLSSDKADNDHLHPYAHVDDVADKDHVHDGYASTSVVDSILRPLTWKYMGQSTPAQDLGPGEFTIATSGNQNSRDGRFKIYLNPYDSSGWPIVAATNFSHDFSDNHMISVQHTRGGGGITGKSLTYYFNVDASPNKYHRLESNWWRVANSLVVGKEFIIQIPGLLPTHGPASSSNTREVIQLDEGELPVAEEQEEQVND